MTAFDGARSVLAVVAHPDDESFGLGAVIANLVEHGTAVSVLCFTHGEASTLHGAERDLGTVRARELAEATRTLGVHRVTLLDYRDAALEEVPMGDLVAHVRVEIDAVTPDIVLIFDEEGITRHPDHRRASEAAREAACAAGRRTVAWAMPAQVAEQLNREFGATFAGRPAGDLEELTHVDRERQRRAIACHPSQATDNRVLWRRLDLLGDTEWVHAVSCRGA